jgi:hypothetical protein
MSEDWWHPGDRQRLCRLGVFEHLHRRGRGLWIDGGQRLGRQIEVREDARNDSVLLQKIDALHRSVAA